MSATLDYAQRRCRGGCGTRLSIHNRGTLCQACTASPTGRSTPVNIVRCVLHGCDEPAAKDSHGARQSRLRNLCQQHFEAELEQFMDEARRAGTTLGAVPLPAPVAGPERTYEDMIRRNGAPPEPAPPPACAECGAELPKRHEGWLCRLCAVAEPADSEHAVSDAEPSSPAAVPTPDPAETPVKTEPAPAPAAPAPGFVPFERQCKIEDCTNEPLARRGVYAYLCAEHKAKRVLPLCRRIGCTEQALAKTIGGKPTRWSNLCAQHYEEARQHASRTTVNRFGPKSSTKPPEPQPPAGARAEALHRLSEIGAQLDTIDAARNALNDQAAAILTEWGELLRALARYDGDPS